MPQLITYFLFFIVILNQQFQSTSSNDSAFFKVSPVKVNNDVKKCGETAILLTIRVRPKIVKHLEEIKVCFDTKTRSTVWTSHYIEPLDLWSPSGFWKEKYLGEEDLGEGVKIDALYNQSDYQKGFFTPKDDFNKHGLDKEMTFHYINAAPRSEVLATGNWKLLEEKLRELAQETDKRIYVRTGTLGVVDYLDKANQRIVVPEKFYKIVYYCEGKEVRNVVFIGENGSTNVRGPVCTDICDEVKELDGDTVASFGQIDKGRVYCCDLEDFQINDLFVREENKKWMYILDNEHFSFLALCASPFSKML